MLKITVAVLAIALAGTASAAGWRSLRIDGSSEASFAESVDAFKDKLSLSRRYAFAWALQDIWVKGVKDAEAAQREYGGYRLLSAGRRPWLRRSRGSPRSDRHYGGDATQGSVRACGPLRLAPALTRANGQRRSARTANKCAER